VPVLNDADALYLGASSVDAVYLGSYLVWPPFDPGSDPTVTVSIDQQMVDGYGANYPLTYAFLLPNVPGLVADYNNGDGWMQLTTPTGRYDGVPAVRFDDGLAYLSAPFGSNGTLQLRIRDGSETVGEFLGVCRYYDNRRCGVVFTYDDWHGNSSSHAGFVAAAADHLATNLWMTPGINANGFGLAGEALSSAQWDDVQDAVDSGVVEPCNHGLNHLNPAQYGTFGTGTAEEDAERELVQGEQAILDNVTMPPQSTRGSTEYVLAYIRAHGGTSAFSRGLLGSVGTLTDRTASGQDPAVRNWPKFVDDDGLFAPEHATSAVGPSTYVMDTTEATAAGQTMKDRFDLAYAGRGLFVGYTYPFGWPAHGPGSAFRDYLEHISASDDIWSVGFGHAFLYRLLSQRVGPQGGPRFVGASATVPNQAPVSSEVVLELPPGEVGDLLVATHGYADNVSFIERSGWTMVDPTSDGYSWGGSTVYYKIATGTDTDVAFYSTNDLTGIVVCRYRGIDQADPLVGWDRTYEETTGASLVAPAVTASGLVVRAWGQPQGGTIMPPSSDSVLVDRDDLAQSGSNRPSILMADHLGTPAAATAVSDGNGTAFRHGWTLVFRPGA
jgi:hypothetical protein